MNFRKMSEKMRERNNYCKNARYCVDKAIQQNGSFAFIYDMPSIQYWKGNY